MVAEINKIKRRLVDWAYHRYWALRLPEKWKIAIHDFYRRSSFSSNFTVDAIPASAVYQAFAKAVRSRFRYQQINSQYIKNASDPEIIAYYLPQFHRTPENDQWWGAGVTEWNNVTRALPQFEGHQQPRVPADLGYYDLRLDDVLTEQARLASSHGISGFAVYFYWFGEDKRLLDAPLNRISNMSDYPSKFCLCWANESWTRRFDGVSSEVLIHQDHSQETYLKFADIALPYLKSYNYFRLQGKPLIVIYRPQLIPRPAAALLHWRNEWRRHLASEVTIIAVCDTLRADDWLGVGFDAETSFQPSQIMQHQQPINDTITPINPAFAGKVFSYRDAVERKLYERVERKKYVPAVASGWDNTPRRENSGVIYHDDTPILYRQWLTDALVFASRSDSKLVFINAWNEWGEGAYLEPDTLNGHGRLLATRDAIILARQAMDNDGNTSAS